MMDTLFLLPEGRAVFVPGDDSTDEIQDRVRRMVTDWAEGKSPVLVLMRPCDVRDWRSA